MLHDLRLDDPGADERHRRTLNRIADVLGCAVGDLMDPAAMEGELAQTAELLRLWNGVEAQTRRAVIEHLRVAVRTAQ